METERLIRLDMICSHYKIETSFVQSLNEFGLIEIMRVDEVECIDREYLSDIERMMNLHYQLNINMEGLDAISHLLKRMTLMQKEMRLLKNKLGSRLILR